MKMTISVSNLFAASFLFISLLSCKKKLSVSNDQLNAEKAEGWGVLPVT
jgi:cytochrome oxidase Cu insertion factor (SCO1/SenC/PrrC family)